MPNRPALRTVSATSAAWTYIFVGTQPTLMHVPPKVPSSMIAMRQSASSGVTSELPEPVPMIARSKWSWHARDAIARPDGEVALLGGCW